MSNHQAKPLTEEQKIKQIESAVVMILQAMGEDWNRPDLKETPNRVARSMLTFSPNKEMPKMTTFEAETGKGLSIVVKDLEVRSLCGHHLLPFFGTATIGYIPKGKKVGLSKFQRALDYVANKPQDQEKLTEELLAFLWDAIQPQYLIIQIEAVHTCMVVRGVKTSTATTKTVLSKGSGSGMEMENLRQQLKNN